MKTLVIYAHHNKNGHHGYFLGLVRNYLQNNKLDFEIIDLYEESFSPVLQASETVKGNTAMADVKKYQEMISESDKLIFIYPTWWQGAPAIMKGFFDRVFASHFAFMYKNGFPVKLLQGKKAAVFSATGAPKIYTRCVIKNKGMRVVVDDILRFCGIRAKGFSVGSAIKFDDKQKKKVDRQFNKLVAYLY